MRRRLYNVCGVLGRALTRRKTMDLDHASDTGLDRCLSLCDLSLIGIGSTLGAGIYVLTGDVARNKSGPAIVLSFFFAAVASLLSGLCYAEFGARIPKAGSAYVYCYLTIGEFVAFVIGWNIILEYVIGAASIARGLTAYIDTLSQHRMQKTLISVIGEVHMPGISNYIDLYALLFVLAFTVILSFGIKNATRLNNALVVINLATILLVIVVGLFYVQPENWKNFMPHGFSGVVSGASTCFFAFIGFDVIATASEEAKNPGKSIPLSIAVTITVCFLAYFGVSAVVTLMVPWDHLDVESAVADAFVKRHLSFFSYVVGIGAITGLLGCTLVSMVPIPRMLYAMAQDGMLIPVFASVNEKTQVPVFGSIVSGILVGVMAMLLDLAALVEMLSIGTLLAYSIVVLSVLVLRYHREPLPTLTRSSVSAELDCSKLGLVLDEKKATSLWDCHRRPPQYVVNIVITCMVLELLGISLLSTFLLKGSLQLGAGAAIGLAFFMAALLVTVGYLALCEQYTEGLSFTAPMLPWLPVLALFFNMYLAMQLSTTTWLRLALWMAIGLFVYFGYSIHHSAERNRSASLSCSDEPAAESFLGGDHVDETGQFAEDEKTGLLRPKGD